MPPVEPLESASRIVSTAEEGEVTATPPVGFESVRPTTWSPLFRPSSRMGTVNVAVDWPSAKETSAEVAT